MEDYLVHYGVLGMKWGVRKERDKSGGSSKKVSKKKSRHQLALEKKYRKAGYSKQEAETQARKRIITERVLAVSAGATLAAIAGYKLAQYRKDQLDSIIKSNETLQRIEMTGEGKLHDAFYVAKEKTDKTKYAGKLGKARQIQTGKSYIMELNSKSDIKVAGRKTAKKTFEDLYNKDAEFRKAAEKYTKHNVHGKNWAFGNTNKMYENFNSALIDHDNEAVKKFYKTLSEKGYGAVQDINDKKFSGYAAKNPLIIFGQSSNITQKSFREMTNSEINKALISDGKREAAKTLAKYGSVGMGVGAAAKYVNDYDPSSEDRAVRNRKYR